MSAIAAPSRRTAAIVGATALAVAAVVAIAGVELRERRRDSAIAAAVTGGDAALAPALVRRYGCGGCHTIPGIAGADGQVAPSLEHLRRRVFIGGGVRHTPDNLVRWIVAPQTYSPQSAMPATGISESEARDVAAFLYARP